MEADELFAKLRPLMGERLERLRLAYLAEDEDGQREIETILRLTYAKRTNERINQGQILLPPPDPGVAAGEFVLGDVAYNDRKVCPFGLRRDELIQHTAIFGRSGSGKTNTVFQMIGQLLKADIPFLIFDWKRNYRDMLSLTDKEVLVFTVGRPVAPIQFNPLIPPPGVEPQVHLKLLVNIIAKAYFCGDGVISLLQQAIDAVYADSGVYDGTNGRYPIMRDVLDWLEKCPAKGRAANWMASTLRAVRSLCFGQMGRVINCDQQLPLADLLDKNVVLELDALEGAEKAFFIDSFLLAIHHYRMGQSTREQLKHCIILEEAHHVLKAHDGAETVTDVILREIRELNTGIILIDQHPSLIALTALGNTYCTVTMNLKTREDMNAAASYTLLDRQDMHMLGELKVGQAIVKLQDRFVRPFLVEFPLIGVRKGVVTDTMISEKMKRYLGDTKPPAPPLVPNNLSQQVPAAEETDNNSIGTTPNFTELNFVELQFLTDVLRHPESGVVQRCRDLNLTRRKVHAVKLALTRRGLIAAVDVSTGSGRTVLLALTTEGKAVLQGKGVDTTGYLSRGGVEHEFWRTRIDESLREQGYAVTHEYHIDGNGAVDILAVRGDERLIVEIETGQSDAVENVRKCLAAGFGHVLVAATTHAAYEKVRRQLGDLVAADDRVELVLCPHRF